jgi:hypothetical protein
MSVDIMGDYSLYVPDSTPDAAAMLYDRGPLTPAEQAAQPGFVGGLGRLFDVEAAPTIQKELDSGKISLVPALGKLVVAAYEQNKPAHVAAAHKVRKAATFTVAAVTTPIEKASNLWASRNTRGLTPDDYPRRRHRMPSPMLAKAKTILGKAADAIVLSTLRA